MARRFLLALTLCLVTKSLLAGEGAFTFAPPDNTRFVRTMTHTARIETGGMVRTESTILKARFVFRQTPSGYTLEMTPLSFRYVVNDRDVESPVWDLIRDRKVRMKFNAVGKLTETKGFETVDETLAREDVAFSANSPSMHLDHLPLGAIESESWDHHILLWLDQPSAPGTKLKFDSVERGFTGERTPSHTTMQVLRRQKCGTAACVVTHYTMTPDLRSLVQHVNEQRNVDLIDATASQTLEQTIEPSTMLPHSEKITWQRTIDTAEPGEEGTWRASLVATSEFVYEARHTKP